MKYHADKRVMTLNSDNCLVALLQTQSGKPPVKKLCKVYDEIKWGRHHNKAVKFLGPAFTQKKGGKKQQQLLAHSFSWIQLR